MIIVYHLRMASPPPPFGLRLYSYSASQKDIIEGFVGEMLRSGIIQPSSSPFSSPVMLVKKKDRSWRICIDYRRLNDSTIKDKFSTNQSTIFSKIDLRFGYHQIRMAATDAYKTTFKTDDGHYKFLVMPFSLINAPATFQGLMNIVFKECLHNFVLVFFDDILVYSKNLLQHVEHQEVVLGLDSFVAKLNKCSFDGKSIQYLGHIVTGIGRDLAKVAAVNEWPQPPSVK